MIAAKLIGVFLVSALWTWAGNWLALIPWRKSVRAGSHWTEQARCLHPARMGASINLFSVTACGFLGSRILWDESWTGMTGYGVVAFLGVLAGTYSIDRETHPWLSFKAWLHQVMAFWFLRLVQWVALLVAGLLLMPPRFELWTWVILGATTLVYGWLGMGGGLWILEKLRLVRDAPETLRRLVRETSTAMNVPVRNIWVISHASVNAFALPVQRSLLFTHRAAEVMSSDELRAITAHELGHLSESRAVLMVRMLGSLAVMPLVLFKPMWTHYQWVGLTIPVILSILILVLVQWVGRRMEVRADKVAADFQAEEGQYARALARLYEENQVPAVLSNKRQTHPHLYDRMVEAGLEPDYPRPAPPSALGWNGQASSVVLGVLLVYLFSHWY